jgi:hypothetical protein
MTSAGTVLGRSVCLKGIMMSSFGKIMGERITQGFHPCTPLKDFLKKVLKNPKNFQKA